MRSIRLHLQGDTERGNDWFINFPKEEIFLLWVWILNVSNLLFSLSFFSYHKPKNRFKVSFYFIFFKQPFAVTGCRMIYSDVWNDNDFFNIWQYKNHKTGKSRTLCYASWSGVLSIDTLVLCALFLSLFAFCSRWWHCQQFLHYVQ